MIVQHRLQVAQPPGLVLRVVCIDDKGLLRPEDLPRVFVGVVVGAVDNLDKLAALVGLAHVYLARSADANVELALEFLGSEKVDADLANFQDFCVDERVVKKVEDVVGRRICTHATQPALPDEAPAGVGKIKSFEATLDGTKLLNVFTSARRLVALVSLRLDLAQRHLEVLLVEVILRLELCDFFEQQLVAWDTLHGHDQERLEWHYTACRFRFEEGVELLALVPTLREALCRALEMNHVLLKQLKKRRNAAHDVANPRCLVVPSVVDALLELVTQII